MHHITNCTFDNNAALFTDTYTETAVISIESSGPITITECTFRNYSVFTEIIVVSNSEGGENGNVVQLEVSTPTQSVSITKCTIQGNSYALITLAV